jgi:hypothetical protein
MISNVRSISKIAQCLGLAALSLVATSALITSANAQNAAAPAAAVVAPEAPTEVSDSIGNIIAANMSTPKKICGAITPIIYSTPAAASDVIENAQAAPELLEPLCECLSKSQTALKSSDPEGAKVVAKAVAASSPAFQACYAVALSPGEGGSQASTSAPTTTADSGGAGSGGNSGAPFSPGGSSGASGFSGGPVSPN